MFTTTSSDLVGVVHLLALPGSPCSSLGRQAVLRRALEDGRALVEGGIGACIVENFGDAPFAQGSVEPHVPAFIAVVAERLRAEFGDALVVGANVLRNDVCAALGAAAASGARFVRVNVLSGAAWTDQGLVQGQARQALLYRRALGLEPPPGGAQHGGVAIVADVCVKHAVPAGELDIVRNAEDAALRGGADVLVVTGNATGGATDLAELHAVREALPHVPVWVGSGVSHATAPEVARSAHGAIVGTALHRDGDIRMPLDRDRVARMVGAFHGGGG